MLFKVISNDKVKILVEKDDIENFENINFEKNSEDTKNAIAIMLIGIYEQTGLNFLNSRVLIESVKGYCNTYYVIITRLTNSETVKNENLDSDEVDMYLFKLEFIEEVIDISKTLKIKNIDLKYSKLYKYRNSLYICLYFTPEVIADNKFNEMIDELSESYSRCKWNLLNDVILQEWGSVISENIIENITAAV